MARCADRRTVGMARNQGRCGHSQQRTGTAGEPGAMRALAPSPPPPSVLHGDCPHPGMPMQATPLMACTVTRHPWGAGSTLPARSSGMPRLQCWPSAATSGAGVLGSGEREGGGATKQAAKVLPWAQCPHLVPPLLPVARRPLSSRATIVCTTPSHQPPLLPTAPPPPPPPPPVPGAGSSAWGESAAARWGRRTQRSCGPRRAASSAGGRGTRTAAGRGRGAWRRCCALMRCR